ncbi:MAG: Flp pilus assembly protein CpaB [Rhodobacteraceae bacterium]|nr:Flp pilus assembly protein CpaB [Paracoccaceae bacterium]
MRLVFGLVLLLGLGLAGFAVKKTQEFMAQNEAQLQQAQAQARQIVPMVEVYAAKRSLRYGERLTPDMVKTIRWPVQHLPEDAFLKLPDPESEAAKRPFFADKPALFPAGAPSRAILRAMEPNETIMAIKVTEPGGNAGIASKLSPGMRAFTIRVDVTGGAFVAPESRVDVYWSGVSAGLAGGSERRNVTTLIQPAMRVIAVNESADQDRTRGQTPRTVTVEANPTQVAALAQAQSTGRLSLSLVSVLDSDTAASSVVATTESTLGIEREAPEVRQQQRVCTIKTRRGDKIIETPVACND